MNNEKNNNLQNIDNYRNKLEDSLGDIFLQYVAIIDQYLIQCRENISIQNKTYHKSLKTYLVALFDHWIIRPN